MKTAVLGHIVSVCVGLIVTHFVRAILRRAFRRKVESLGGTFADKWHNLSGYLTIVVCIVAIEASEAVWSAGGPSAVAFHAFISELPLMAAMLVGSAVALTLVQLDENSERVRKARESAETGRKA